MQIQQITSKENAKLKAAAKLVHSKKERVATGSFLAEGCRLCTDALNSGRRPLRVFVTEQLAHKLSDTQTPQGVFCVFPILDNCAQLDTIKKNRIVILSSLQDPGNIGTIIRTAEAFGVDMILISADCPDLYAPKTLRATMGGVFRLPVVVVEDLRGQILSLHDQGVQVYAAALHRDSVPITELNFQQPSAVVIGNEGNGLTEEIIAACTKPMVIPMAGRAESLNAAVAATVAIWEMCKGQ